MHIPVACSDTFSKCMRSGCHGNLAEVKHLMAPYSTRECTTAIKAMFYFDTIKYEQTFLMFVVTCNVSFFLRDFFQSFTLLCLIPNPAWIILLAGNKYLCAVSICRAKVVFMMLCVERRYCNIISRKE